MVFNHENLKVYQRALLLNAGVAGWIAPWESKHAITDHLPRAAESVLDNIAAASAAYSAMKLKCLDYAIGSALESAACLDIASVKRLLDPAAVPVCKGEIAEIVRMLVGLKRTRLPLERQRSLTCMRCRACSHRPRARRGRSFSLGFLR